MSKIRHILRRLSPWPISLVLVLAAPLVLDGTFKMAPSWPRVTTGDEPHYLVMLHSLLNDGDLDVANNYASIPRGSADAGVSFAGSALDHHVNWYEGDRLVRWWQVFENEPEDWQRDALGNPVPTLRERWRRDAVGWYVDPPGALPVPDGIWPGSIPEREYSWHPAAMPMLLSALLLPLRRSDWIEPAALCCSTLAVVAAMFLFRMLIAPYAHESRTLWVATAVAFLGTPVWHYGRTLFCEPYMLACAVGAYAVALRRSSFLLAGFLIGLGTLMKQPFVLLALPLAAHAIGSVGAARELLFDLGGKMLFDLLALPHAMGSGAARKLLLLAAPIVLSIAALFAFNYHMHGSWFRSTQRWQSGGVVYGAVGLLYSHDHGLLPFAPAALVAAPAWPRFWRRHRPDALALLSGFLIYFGLMSAWIAWHGSTCYGPRMIIPVIPFLFAPLPLVPQCTWWRNRVARAAAVIVCLVSIATNAFGALCHAEVWDKWPLAILYAWCAG